MKFSVIPNVMKTKRLLTIMEMMVTPDTTLSFDKIIFLRLTG